MSDAVTERIFQIWQEIKRKNICVFHSARANN